MKILGAGEIAQPLKAVSAPPEMTGLIPRTYTATHIQHPLLASVVTRHSTITQISVQMNT